MLAHIWNILPYMLAHIWKHLMYMCTHIQKHIYGRCYHICAHIYKRGFHIWACKYKMFSIYVQAYIEVHICKVLPYMCTYMEALPYIHVHIMKRTYT